MSFPSGVLQHPLKQPPMELTQEVHFPMNPVAGTGAAGGIGGADGMVCEKAVDSAVISRPKTTSIRQFRKKVFEQAKLGIPILSAHGRSLAENRQDNPRELIAATLPSIKPESPSPFGRALRGLSSIQPQFPLAAPC